MTVAGSPTRGHPELYRRIGLVPEAEAVYPFLTGRQFVVANARLQGMSGEQAVAAAARAIDHVDLGAAQDRAIGTYSKGMRQRIKVASALVHDPPVLLLDEPFNGMDPRQRLQMMDLLRQMSRQGRVILFSSHILEEVERVAERVLVIVAGRLAASGDFREIRRLMTDRPHTFTVRSSDDRALAAALMNEPSTARRVARRWADHRAHRRLRRLQPSRGRRGEAFEHPAARAAAHRRVAGIGLQLPGAPVRSGA